VLLTGAGGKGMASGADSFALTGACILVLVRYRAPVEIVREREVI